MIIILNGAQGVGKTVVARRLIGYFDRAVMLDGEFVCSQHPPETGASGPPEYRYQTVRHLIAFHGEHGFAKFVVNDEFPTSQGIRRLRSLLADVDDEIHTFRLTCAEGAFRRRIQAAGAPDVEKAVRHFRDVTDAQEAAARGADMGIRIDTSAIAPAQVAEAIWQNVREEVGLTPHNPLWWEAYDAERTRIQGVIGHLTIGLHHVGSTAVPGIPARPVIDMMAVVRRLDDALLCIAPLAELGYWFIDHPVNTDRRFFRKGFPRTHHLHIVEEGSRTLADNLDFRDALRARPEWRERYALLKADLAARCPTDRARHSSSKGAFVEEVLREYRGQPLHPLAE